VVEDAPSITGMKRRLAITGAAILFIAFIGLLGWYGLGVLFNVLIPPTVEQLACARTPEGGEAAIAYRVADGEQLPFRYEVFVTRESDPPEKRREVWHSVGVEPHQIMWRGHDTLLVVVDATNGPRKENLREEYRGRPLVVVTQRLARSDSTLKP
jgi:hypothetical protein